jgi:folate-binding protein YgfZ
MPNEHTPSLPTPLPHLAALRFSGADAGRFLHAQLSADIEGLAEGESTFACLCQPKGRVIALLLVWRRADHLLVLCARSLAAGILPYLQRYVFRDDVSITFLEETTVIGQAKPAGEAAGPLPGLAYSLADAKEDEEPKDEAEAFRAHELTLGVAWLDEKTSEAFLPQMMGAGAIGALNYRKGCYPGQEVVARTHYLGRLKQRPLLARLAADDAPGVMDEVRVTDGEGQEAQGRLLDRARRADGGWQLLLVVRAPEPFEASLLEWGTQEGRVVVHWPEPDVLKGSRAADQPA